MLFQPELVAQPILNRLTFYIIKSFSQFLGILGKPYLFRGSFFQAGHLPQAELISKKVSSI